MYENGNSAQSSNDGELQRDSVAVELRILLRIMNPSLV